MSGAEHWERQAERWTAWARDSGDAYWDESGPPFFELLPPPGRRTLELGCGEGRVTRDLRGRGHTVVGVDVSPNLVRFAREADPKGEYVVCEARRGRHEVRFFGWAYPLEDYTRAFEDAGFLIEALREPPDPMRPLPNFLLVRALKP